VTEPVGALEYHRLTVHHPDREWPADRRLVRGFRPMQWETRPPPHKTYPGHAAALLPDDLGPGGERDLDLALIGRLLFLSAGVVRTLPMAGGPMWFRAAGSAGNLAPVEVYLLTGELDGLEAGLYHYEPVDHALVRLGDVPGDTPPALVLTGVPWRTCWKYRERGFRHLWWDAGTMLAHVLAVAADAGLDARVELGFVDADVAALVGADRVHELPLAVVGLRGPPVLPPPGPVPAGHLADDPFEFPLVTAAYRAGELAGPADVAGWREAAAEPCAIDPPEDAPIAQRSEGGRPRRPPWEGTLEEVVLRRGSARRFDPGAVAPAALVSEGLSWATAPVPLDVLPSGGTLLEHLLLVHAVEGVGPGGYRLDGAGLVELGVGDVRDVGRYLCLGQRLGGDGALTAFHAADLGRVTAVLGDRGYRAALLEAGVVEGRLHLAAYGLGLGATGLTFFDEEVSRFFTTAAAPMLVTAVGAVPYRTRPGGRPRQPVKLRAR
jgi:nitroreductase